MRGNCSTTLRWDKVKNSANDQFEAVLRSEDGNIIATMPTRSYFFNCDEKFGFYGRRIPDGGYDNEFDAFLFHDVGEDIYNKPVFIRAEIDDKIRLFFSYEDGEKIEMSRGNYDVSYISFKDIIGITKTELQKYFEGEKGRYIKIEPSNSTVNLYNDDDEFIGYLSDQSYLYESFVLDTFYNHNMNERFDYKHCLLTDTVIRDKVLQKNVIYNYFNGILNDVEVTIEDNKCTFSNVESEGINLYNTHYANGDFMNINVDYEALEKFINENTDCYVTLNSDEEKKDLTQKYNKCQTAKGTLEGEKENLSNEVKNLNQQKDQCQTAKEALDQKNNELTSKVNSLNQEKTQCQTAKETLEGEKTELLSKIEDFTQKNNTLCKELNDASVGVSGKPHQCMNDTSSYSAAMYDEPIYDVSAHQLIA